MIARIVTFVVALAALATAAGVLVVSATFAGYALLRAYIGPSGAAACMTLLAALILGGLAAFLLSKAKGSAPKAPVRKDGEQGLAERLTAILSDRPVVAAGAAVAAGLLAWRNPTLVSALLRVMDARSGGVERR